MSLPCKCYLCARCILQKSKKDEHCLAIEKIGCDNRDCDNCDFECKRFVKNLLIPKEKSKLLDMLPT